MLPLKVPFVRYGIAGPKVTEKERNVFPPSSLTNWMTLSICERAEWNFNDTLDVEICPEAAQVHKSLARSVAAVARPGEEGKNPCPGAIGSARRTGGNG